MNTEQMSALAIAASQFGPDFYAVLLITFVTAAAGTLLLRAQKNRPALSGEQLRPYCVYFYLSCGLGMAAIVVSIGWWLYKQTHGTHTVQVAITNVAPNVKIDSRYFSKITFHQNTADGTLVADEYFLIVNDRPFSDKDNFEFDVFVIAGDGGPVPSACASAGGVTKKETLKVSFSGQAAQSYRLEMDSSSPPRLSAVASAATSQWFSQSEGQVAQLALGDAK